MKIQCSLCGNEFEKTNRSIQCSEKCRLLSRIKIENECWIWTGPTSWHGYGKTTYKGKTCRVHRMSYEVFKGEISGKKIVCHSCDNKMCINPDHLWLGSHKENTQDAKKKGRLINGMLGKKHSDITLKKMRKKKKSNKKGENHHINKLKNDDVFSIREMLKNNISQNEISKIFGVHQSSISFIKNKKRWSHI